MVTLEQIGTIIVIVFLLIVLLPSAMSFTNEATDGDGDLREDTDALKEFVKPWWLDLATAAPILFIGIAFVLVFVGADEIL